MPLPLPVALTPTALAGGVLASASPLPAGWENGVEFLSNACLVPERVAVCPENYTGTPDAVGSETFLPFDMRQGVKCSSQSRLDVAKVAGEVMEITDEYLIGQELQDGTASSNPSLNDATILGNVDTPEEAIALIEAAGAAALAGRLIVIHVPPVLAAYLPEICYQDSAGNWRTPFGSLVVMSPGYTGTTVWGTGEIYAMVGTVELKAKMDRSVNTDEGWAERPGIVVFDPCFLVAVETPDSPGSI
ncbi:MAG: hypothetical protein IMZ54_04800 [Acidobacteria bacterium]|nr:hypothetical protein [Acidobacteriota bacterium]